MFETVLAFSGRAMLRWLVSLHALVHVSVKR